MRIVSLIFGVVTGLALVMSFFTIYSFAKPENAMPEEEVVVVEPPVVLESETDAEPVAADIAVPEDGVELAEIDVDIRVEGLDIASRNLALRAESMNGEMVPQAELFDGTSDCVQLFPDDLYVLIAETKDYRLDRVDLIDLPCGVEIAIWPDSPLSISEQGYYLITPPTDIMEMYYVQAATADVSDFYFDTMPFARGIFVRRGKRLLETTRLGELFIEQMAKQGKAIIALQADIPESTYDKIVADHLQFARIEHVLDVEDLESDWAMVLENHTPGVTEVVLLEAEGADIDSFKSIIGASKRVSVGY